jgi:hypothetical protein
LKKQYIVRDNNTGARYSVTEDEIETEINPPQEQHGTTPPPKPKARNEILAFKKAIEESRNYR